VQPLIIPLAAARAWIARRILGEEHAPVRSGSVTLRPHQQSAVARLRTLLQRHGGALLADDVGLGKTFVAAALLREARCPLVVAPAALGDMWQRALHAAGARAHIVSYTSLGRDAAPAGPFDFIVMDEAHHARTPTTRRYARLAALTARAPVLLLTATPIHNARRDLAALVALFLGARAYTLNDDALAQYVVRRERADVRGAAIPEATEPRWLAVGDDTHLLEHILALPPPLPPADGGSGGALLAWNLVRQWASSTGALVGALRRRLVRAAALDAALEQGHRLTRRELSDWECGDDAVQLALPGLFATPPVHDHALRDVLATHLAALQQLLRRAQASDAADTARARGLSDVRTAHPGEKIVAFSQFTDTIDAMFRLMRRTPGVAALTSHGARVAGGTLTRAEALARFAPRASGARPPRDIERIDLLLTTDLLSEGINLSDASVVSISICPGPVRDGSSGWADRAAWAPATTAPASTHSHHQRRPRQCFAWKRAFGPSCARRIAPPASPVPSCPVWRPSRATRAQPARGNASARFWNDGARARASRSRRPLPVRKPALRPAYTLRALCGSWCCARATGTFCRWRRSTPASCGASRPWCWTPCSCSTKRTPRRR
jgi:superfamily II DNA or RNA helicase